MFRRKGLYLAGAGLALLISSNIAQAANVSVADGANDEDSGNLVFTVTRDSDAGTTSFDFTFSNGTASNDDWDTGAAVGSASVGPGGPLVFDISVPITADSTVELDETVNLTIVSTSGDTITDGDAVGTIVNDDSSVISVTNPAATEGTSLQFTVSCTNPVDVAVTYTGTWNDGTAIGGGNDYSISDGQNVNFGDGCAADSTPTTGTTADNTVELDETLTFTLSALNASGRDVSFAGGLATEVGTGTILNDDAALLSVRNASAPESEGIDLVCELSNPIDVNIGFSIQTQDVTATAGQDYSAVSGGKTIFAGNSGTFTFEEFFTVNDDPFVEDDEVFQLIASALEASGRNVTFDQSVADLTIINNDEYEPVPTQSGWGLWLMAVLLLMMGGGFLRRTRN